MSFLDKLNSPVLVAVVLVVFLILDGFLFYRYQQSMGNDAASIQVEEIAKEATTSAEEQDGVQVLVSVSTPVGLSIQEDRQLVHDQVNNLGFYEEFEAEGSITIAAANGGAVEVGVAGENLEPLGESGEGVTRTFTTEPERGSA